MDFIMYVEVKHLTIYKCQGDDKWDYPIEYERLSPAQKTSPGCCHFKSLSIGSIFVTP